MRQLFQFKSNASCNTLGRLTIQTVEIVMATCQTLSKCDMVERMSCNTIEKEECTEEVVANCTDSWEVTRCEMINETMSQVECRTQMEVVRGNCSQRECHTEFVTETRDVPHTVCEDKAANNNQVMVCQNLSFSNWDISYKSV